MTRFSKRDARRAEELPEEALEEAFPASDPVAASREPDGRKPSARAVATARGRR